MNKDEIYEGIKNWINANMAVSPRNAFFVINTFNLLLAELENAKRLDKLPWEMDNFNSAENFNMSEVGFRGPAYDEPI